MFKEKSTGGCKAFTLTELMVSAVIAGFLGVILVPAFSGTGEQSRHQRCSLNLMEIGMAEQIYAEDYGGYAFSSYTRDYENPDRQLRSHYVALEAYADYGYIPRDEDLLTCPSWPEESFHIRRTYGMFAETELPAEYVSFEVDGRGSDRGWTRLASVELPSSFAFRADSIAPRGEQQTFRISPAPSPDRTAGDSRGMHARHEGRVNVLFADGNVSAVTVQELKEHGEEAMGISEWKVWSLDIEELKGAVD